MEIYDCLNEINKSDKLDAAGSCYRIERLLVKTWIKNDIFRKIVEGDKVKTSYEVTDGKSETPINATELGVNSEIYIKFEINGEQYERHIDPRWVVLDGKRKKELKVFRLQAQRDMFNRINVAANLGITKESIYACFEEKEMDESEIMKKLAALTNLTPLSKELLNKTKSLGFGHSVAKNIVWFEKLKNESLQQRILDATIAAYKHHADEERIAGCFDKVYDAETLIAKLQTSWVYETTVYRAQYYKRREKILEATTAAFKRGVTYSDIWACFEGNESDDTAVSLIKRLHREVYKKTNWFEQLDGSFQETLLDATNKAHEGGVPYVLIWKCIDTYDPADSAAQLITKLRVYGTILFQQTQKDNRLDAELRKKVVDATIAAYKHDAGDTIWEYFGEADSSERKDAARILIKRLVKNWVPDRVWEKVEKISNCWLMDTTVFDDIIAASKSGNDDAIWKCFDEWTGDMTHDWYKSVLGVIRELRLLAGHLWEK